MMTTVMITMMTMTMLMMVVMVCGGFTYEGFTYWYNLSDFCHHHDHVAIDDFIVYENHCYGNVEC